MKRLLPAFEGGRLVFKVEGQDTFKMKALLD